MVSEVPEKKQFFSLHLFQQNNFTAHDRIPEHQGPQTNHHWQEKKEIVNRTRLVLIGGWVKEEREEEKGQEEELC